MNENARVRTHADPPTPQPAHLKPRLLPGRILGPEWVRWVSLPTGFRLVQPVTVTVLFSSTWGPQPHMAGPGVSIRSAKKQESSRKTSIYALLTTPKPLTVWITTNCGKLFRRWEYQTTGPAS